MSQAVATGAHRSRAHALGASALCGLLVLGGSSPALAEQPARSDRPIYAVDSSASQNLRTQVQAARALYRAEERVATAQYELALTPAKSARDAALAQAESKADRRAAQIDFLAAQSGAQTALESALSAAAAKRDAAIDKALAEYLLATGKSAVLDALQEYQTATKLAAATLELALNSAKAAYKTDTSDEREDLDAEIAAATSAGERALAWAKYESATRDEQAAYRTSVNSARTTYRSALKKARSEFRATTGMSTKRLQTLPFRI